MWRCRQRQLRDARGDQEGEGQRGQFHCGAQQVLQCVGDARGHGRVTSPEWHAHHPTADGAQH